MSPSRRAAVAALVAVLGGALLHAAPASAAADITAPTLAGAVGYVPASLDITTGEATSAISMLLADDASGVVAATLTLTGPTGPADLDLARTDGSATRGTWTGQQTYAALFDQPGRYLPTTLTITDAAGNVATLTTGLGAGLTVTRTDDSTAPVLVGATATTTAIDTTRGPVDVPVRVRAIDDLSGVGSGTVTFTSPDGQDEATGYLAGAPAEGTGRDGGWDVLVTFPARSTSGVWRLSSIDLADEQYNQARWDSASYELPLLAVRVTTADDTDAPALTSFAVGPAKRSTAYGRSGYVYAQVAFTDAVSGVATAQVTLQRPNGTIDDAELEPVGFDSPDALKSGTSRNGTLTVAVYVENLVAGTWKVASVDLTDVAGNLLSVPNAQLGTRASFDVSTAAADTSAPTSTGFAFSPGSLDTRTATASGSLLVAVTDPDAVPSGFARGSVTLASPSGQESATAPFTVDDLTAGDPAAGTFRAPFTLPQGSEDGTWRVVSMSLTDVANRTATLTSFASAPTLTVLGAGRAPATPPGAPEVSAPSVSGTTATLAWRPPADNGGAAITRYTVTVYRDDTAVSSVTASGTSVAVPNLQRGRTYSFAVTAENAAGVGPASARTAAVTVAAAAPGAPEIGTATLDATGATSATVTWRSPADDGGAAVTGYTVTPYVNGVAQPATSVALTTTATLTGLARGRTHVFRVAAVNSVGTGPRSLPSNGVTPAPTVPAAPAVTGATVAGTSAIVRWNVPDDGGAAITRYEVRGEPTGACTTTGTSCVVTGLTPQTSYTFRVTAVNTVGTGDTSTPSPTVVAVAPRPTAIAITAAPCTVTYGATATVAGRLTVAGGALAGQRVWLQYRSAGGAWTTGPAATSGTDGRFALTFRPPRTVQVHLVAQPGAAYVGSTSAARTITVKRTVTLGTSRSVVSRGSRAVLSGRANPGATGRVLLQRWSGGWKTVATTTLRDGAYAVAVRLATKGSYTFRAVTAGDAAFATTASGSRIVRAR